MPDDINISTEEFRQASQQEGESQNIGDADGEAEGNTTATASNAAGGSTGPALIGPDGQDVTASEAETAASGGRRRPEFDTDTDRDDDEERFNVDFFGVRDVEARLDPTELQFGGDRR